MNNNFENFGRILNSFSKGIDDARVETLKALREKVKNIPMEEERDMATYWDCRDDVLDIIDDMIKELIDGRTLQFNASTRNTFVPGHENEE